MNTPLQTSTPSFVYHRIPTKVSRKDFNQYIEPHLKRPKTGPKPKLSLYKIFNYILYVLNTGIQWDQLKTKETVAEILDSIWTGQVITFILPVRHL